MMVGKKAVLVRAFQYSDLYPVFREFSMIGNDFHIPVAKVGFSH